MLMSVCVCSYSSTGLHLLETVKESPFLDLLDELLSLPVDNGEKKRFSPSAALKWDLHDQITGGVGTFFFYMNDCNDRRLPTNDDCTKQEYPFWSLNFIQAPTCTTTR